MKVSFLLAIAPLTLSALAKPTHSLQVREYDLPGNLAAIIQGVTTAVSQGDPTGVLQALENVAGTFDAPTTPEEALSELQAIFNGTTAAPTTIYEYIATLEALNLIDSIDSLLNYAAGVADGADSPDNVNPAPPDDIYPQKAAGDAIYTVDEATLRAAIYIPSTFTYGSRKPIILFPGTGNYGYETFIGNFIPLLSQSGVDLDYVWVNVPDRLLDDAQKNAEFAAYAINYISSITGNQNNVAVVAWSQGNIDTQWALKYWPSTRSVTTDHVAISPDYAGTVDANFVALPGEPLPPSVLQQEYLASSNFITTLRNCNGDSAYVPTTTIYSGFFDEIVEPQQGTGASAFLNDVRGVGVTNNQVQLVCPGQPAGTFYTHEGVLYNPLAWYLFLDAISRDGPGDPANLDLTTVCSTYLTPGLNVGDFLVTENTVAIAGLSILTYPDPVFVEPAISAYAATSTCSTITSTMTTTTGTATTTTTSTLTSTTSGTVTTTTSGTVTTTTTSTVTTTTSGTVTTTSSDSSTTGTNSGSTTGSTTAIYTGTQTESTTGLGVSTTSSLNTGSGAGPSTGTSGGSFTSTTPGTATTTTGGLPTGSTTGTESGTFTDGPTPPGSLSSTFTNGPKPSGSLGGTLTSGPAPSGTLSGTYTDRPTPSGSLSTTFTDSPQPSGSFSGVQTSPTSVASTNTYLSGWNEWQTLGGSDTPIKASTSTSSWTAWTTASYETHGTPPSQAHTDSQPWSQISEYPKKPAGETQVSGTWSAWSAYGTGVPFNEPQSSGTWSAVWSTYTTDTRMEGTSTISSPSAPNNPWGPVSAIWAPPASVSVSVSSASWSAVDVEASSTSVWVNIPTNTYVAGSSGVVDITTSASGSWTTWASVAVATGSGSSSSSGAGAGAAWNNVDVYQGAGMKSIMISGVSVVVAAIVGAVSMLVM